MAAHVCAQQFAYRSADGGRPYPFGEQSKGSPREPLRGLQNGRLRVAIVESAHEEAECFVGRQLSHHFEQPLC
jgi:hypothetical protein